MNFNVRIYNLLIILTLTLFTHTTRADYVDIGYRNGMVIDSTARLSKGIYITGSKYNAGEVIGLGTGYDAKKFNVILTFNQLTEDDKVYKTQLEFNYYDVNFSYSASVDCSNTGELGYKIGAGYALNEKISLVVNYSDHGVFFGVRRWILF